MYAEIKAAPEFDAVEDALAYFQERFYTDGISLHADDAKMLTPNKVSVRAAVQLHGQMYASYSAIGTGATVSEATTDALVTAFGWMGVKIQKPVSYAASDRPPVGDMPAPTLPTTGDTPRTINAKGGDPEVARMLSGLQQIYRGNIKKCACGDMVIKGVRTQKGDVSALWSCPQNNKDHESWIDRDVKNRALGFNG